MNNSFVELPSNSSPKLEPTNPNNKFVGLDVFSKPITETQMLSNPYAVIPLNKIEGVGRYLNSSTYKKLGYSLAPDLENKYYQETPWYNQLGNATAQFFGQAGAAFEAQMSKLEQIKETFGTTDGDYLKDAFQASEDLREKYPVFKSANETYGLLGYTPFGDDAFSKWSNFIPNLGFTAGTMAGVFLENAVATAIIEGTTGGTATPFLAGKWIKSLYAGIKDIKTFNDIRKLASAAKIGKGIYEAEKALGSAGNIVRGVEAIKAGKSLNGALHSIYGGYQLYSSAAAEAMIENANSIGEVMGDFKRDFIEKNGREPNGEELAKMQESAEGLILPSSLGNIGILMASNALQEMNAFKAGKSLSAFAVSGSGKIGEAVGKRVILDKSTGLYRDRLASEISRGKWLSTGRFLLGIGSEGLEESAQGVVAEATKNYFKAKYYNKPIGWTDALGQGFAYAASDQGMEEFYAGIVTGGIFSGGGKTINQYQLKRDEKALFQKTGKTIEQLATDERTDLNEVIPLLKYNLATSQSSENVKVQTVIQQKMNEAYSKGQTIEGDIFKGAGLTKAMFTAKYYGKDEELLNHYKELNKLERADLAKYLNVTEDELSSPEDFEKTLSHLEYLSSSIDRVAKKLKNPVIKRNLSDPKYADMTPEQIQEEYIKDNSLFEAWQGAQELLVMQDFVSHITREKHDKIKANLALTNVPMDLLAAVLSKSDVNSKLYKRMMSLNDDLSDVYNEINVAKQVGDKKELKVLNATRKEILADIDKIGAQINKKKKTNAEINYLQELNKKAQNVALAIKNLEETEKTKTPEYKKYQEEFLNLMMEKEIVGSPILSQEQKLEKLNELRPDDNKFNFNRQNLLGEDNINNVKDLIKAFDLLGRLKENIDLSEDVVNTLSNIEGMEEQADAMFNRIYSSRKELFSNIVNDINDETPEVEKEIKKEEPETKEATKKKPKLTVGAKVVYDQYPYTIKSIKFKDGETTYILESEEGKTIEVTDASLIIPEEVYEEFNEAVMRKLAEVQDEEAFVGNRPLTEEEKKIQDQIIEEQKAKFNIKEPSTEVKQSTDNESVTKEEQSTSDIEEQRVAIEIERNKELDKNSGISKLLETPTQNKQRALNKARIVLDNNKELVEQLEKEFTNEDETLFNELNDKLETLLSKVTKGEVNFRFKEGKVVLVVNEVKKGNTINHNYTGIREGQIGEFEVGDLVQVNNGSVAIPGKVTKVSSTGRIAEVEDESGEILIRNGVVLSSNAIQKQKEINAKYNAKLTALETKEKTQVPTIEKVIYTKEEFLILNEGRIVSINGVKGILRKVTDYGYTVETPNRIYEFSIDEINTFKNFSDPKEIKKYNVSNITENEVVVNNVKYIINTDEKGNISSLSPVNNPKQRIKNQKLLIAVEIERNKLEVERFNNTSDLDKLKTVYPNLDILLKSIWDKNYNDTIDQALEKLYDKQELTPKEALQVSLWLSEVFNNLIQAINPDNSQEENDTIVQAYNTAEIINSLLYDLNNITTNYDEDHKAANNVGEVEDNVSSKRSQEELEEVKPTKEKKPKKGAKEKLVEKLKKARQMINEIKDVNTDVAPILKVIGKKNYDSWKNGLNQETLALDLEDLTAPWQDPSESDVQVMKYLLNRYIDNELELLGETTLSTKEEADAIKAEPGNTGNITVTDTLDSLNPVSEETIDEVKSKEQFISDLVDKLVEATLQGVKYEFSSSEKEFYDKHKEEIDKQVEDIVNKKEIVDEDITDENNFIKLFNDLLLITKSKVKDNTSSIYNILRRIKLSIADSWYKFKSKEVSSNLKSVLEELSSKFKNLSFENVAKKFIDQEGKEGVELYTNRVINNAVKENYDKFELFRHQHSLHLDITPENTKAVMEVLLDFVNNNKVYMLIGSAYNIARPDNIRIYSKDKKLSTEVLDKLISNLTSITSSTLDNPVISDVKYERLPSTEELKEFINGIDPSIKEQVLNFLGIYGKDRSFLEDKSPLNYKNGLSVNSLAAAKILVKAFDKFKESGKISSKDIIEPVINQQIKKAAFYGEVNELYNELLSNPAFDSIRTNKYFSNLLAKTKEKMDKLSVFNFGNKTLSIGTKLYDKDNSYTIIDNTILDIDSKKNKELKYIKVLKLKNNSTKEIITINQFEFRNNFSTEPMHSIASPEDLKEEQDKEKQNDLFNRLPSSLFTTISNDTDIFFIETGGKKDKRIDVDENSAVGRLVVQRIYDKLNTDPLNLPKVKFETPGYDKEDSPFYLEPGKRNPNVPQRIEDFILEKLNGKKFNELSPEELAEVKGLFGKTASVVDKQGNYITYDKNGYPNTSGIIPMFFIPKGQLVIKGDTISYGGRQLMSIPDIMKKTEKTREEIINEAKQQSSYLDSLHASTNPEYVTIEAVSEGVKDDDTTLSYEDVEKFDKEGKLKLRMSQVKSEKGQLYLELNNSSVKLKQKAIGEEMAMSILGYLGVEDAYFLSRGFKVGKGIKSRYSELRTKLFNLDENDILTKYTLKKDYLDFLNRVVFKGSRNFDVLFDVYFMMDSNPEIFDAVMLRDYNSDKSNKEGSPILFPIANTWKRLNNNKNNDDYYSYLDTVVNVLSKLVFDTNPDFVQSTNSFNFVTDKDTLDIQSVKVTEYLMGKYDVPGIIVNDSLLNSMNRYMYLKPLMEKKAQPQVAEASLDTMLENLLKIQEDSELPTMSILPKSLKDTAINPGLPATDAFKNEVMTEIRTRLNNENIRLSQEDSINMKKDIKNAKTIEDVNKVKGDILEKYNCK